MLLDFAPLFGLSFQFGGFGEGFDRNVPDNSESFHKKVMLLIFATFSIFATILYLENELNARFRANVSD
jgi:hypothetical protein